MGDCRCMTAHLADGDVDVYECDGDGIILSLLSLAYNKMCGSNFYQYYNRMVNSYEDNKNNKNVVLEIAGFIVIIFVVLLFLWREIIYSPKSNIENKIKLLSDTYDNIDVNYTTEIINNVSFKLAKSLKVKEDILLDNVRFIEKGSVLGYIGDIIIAVDNEATNNPR